jgi:hypothetical protein
MLQNRFQFIFTQLVFTCTLVFIITACDKVKKPKPETEHEAITTLGLVFSAAGEVVDTVWFDDSDGVGGLPPQRWDSIHLQTNKEYNVQVLLWNKTKTPTQDIAPIITNQGFAHEFFFLPQGLDLQIEKTDRDGLGFPLGFFSKWTSSNNNQTGTVRVKLMHKPSVKGPNDSPNLGHSDVDVVFQTYIK